MILIAGNHSKQFMYKLIIRTGEKKGGLNVLNVSRASVITKTGWKTTYHDECGSNTSADVENVM